MYKIMVALSATLLLTACNWVQLTSGGEGVRLTTAGQIAGCTRVGRTLTHTVSRVTVVERGVDKQQSELVTLARNEAADLGGNVIVPESIITDGEQSFGVYRCP